MFMKIAAAALAGACLAFPAAARDLTVVAWGGTAQEALTKLYFEPYMKETGIKLQEDSWSGGIGVLRTKVQGGNATWDIIQVEADELALGCEEGLFLELDWDKLGGRDKFMKEAVGDCGVGAVVWSTGLVYDGSRFAEGPKSWADFWDVEKFPGKRALRKGPKYTLEFALMADGVARDQVYEVLRTEEGVARAFRKLDELKSNIVWWTGGSQPPQLVGSGEVAMAGAYVSRLFAANDQAGKNFKVVWDGSIFAVDSWVILRDTPYAKEASDLVAYMSRGDVQRDYPRYAYQGVTNLEAIANPPKEVADILPGKPENRENALALDVDFWVENIDQLNQRFNAWAGQ